MNHNTVTLASLCYDKGSYGIPASAVDYSVDLPTYLRITDINDDGTINFSSLKSVDHQDASKYLLSPNDIVFARTGASTGRNYFYDGKDGDFVYAGFLIKFSINPEKVNPRFIKYYCQSQVYYDWVSSFNTGSTRGNINAVTLAGMPIPKIDRDLQELIVQTLSPLDEKIKLNNRIIANLEAQAQTIFKSWFVDFEPFQGGEFEESELGLIPKGWRVGTLDELIDIRYGKDHKKLGDGSIPVYGSGGIMRFADQSIYSGESVLIPRKGTLSNVLYVTGQFWTVDTMFYTIMRQNNIAKFVYLYVLGLDLASMNSGSAVPSMTTNILNAIRLGIPDDKDLESFESVVSRMYKLMKQLETQNGKLAKLRDTLLPKLMSGKIEVPVEG